MKYPPLSLAARGKFAKAWHRSATACAVTCCGRAEEPALCGTLLVVVPRVPAAESPPLPMVHAPYFHVNARNRFAKEELMNHPFCSIKIIPGSHLLARLETACPQQAGEQQISPISEDFVRGPCAKGSLHTPLWVKQSPVHGGCPWRSLERSPQLAGGHGVWSWLCMGGSVALWEGAAKDLRGSRSTPGPGSLGRATRPCGLTARLHLWHVSYLAANTKITCFSWKTAKTSERLIVSQVIFSIQIELNGSWKQLCIKLQQTYTLFRPTQANINGSVTW